MLEKHFKEYLMQFITQHSVAIVFVSFFTVAGIAAVKEFGPAFVAGLKNEPIAMMSSDSETPVC